MQLCLRQNLSSLNRRQTVSFSTCRMNSASFFLNSIVSGSTIDGNAVAARTHARSNRFRRRESMSVIGPTSPPLVRRINVQFLAQRVERHFQIFDHRVALVLVSNVSSLRSLDGVLEQVEQTPDAGALLLLEQLLAAAGHQHGLHIAFGLRQVEQLPAVLVAPHLDEALRLVVAHVRQGAGRDVEIGIAAFVGVVDDAVGQADQIAQRLFVAGVEFHGRAG